LVLRKHTEGVGGGGVETGRGGGKLVGGWETGEGGGIGETHVVGMAHVV